MICFEFLFDLILRNPCSILMLDTVHVDLLNSLFELLKAPFAQAWLIYTKLHHNIYFGLRIGKRASLKEKIAKINLLFLEVV